MKHGLKLILAVALAAITTTASRADDKPIKVLLVTGGCCHDYANQKEILKKGLEERANVLVDVVWGCKTNVKDGATTVVNDNSTKPAIPIYGNPDYAKGYDVVIHDECSAGIDNEAVVRAVLKPHMDGIPGVNLHCAMHCYRIGSPNDKVTDHNAPHALWFNYLGLQSSGHGPQAPIAITYTDKESPITKGLADWTTIKEEHYNNVAVFDNAHELARGKQTVKQKDGSDKSTDWMVTWTSTYGEKKTRVFSTTIGHNNETVADPKYLDLVTRGLLWAVNRPDALKKK